MKKPTRVTKVTIGPDKEKCQEWHFYTRLRERLGIRMSEEQYDHLVSCLKNNKECNFCEIKYLYDQSQRLMVFELTFPDKVPVNVVYDTKRKTIVTLLFQQDSTEINHYYDVFNNKIQVKHQLGYNDKWKLEDDMLTIPSETVISHSGLFEVVSEGILQGKLFKHDGECLYEVMG